MFRYVFLVFQAILHQWEAESREGERERDGGGGHNIVINGGPQWAQNGYSVVATARNDNNHTRSRGCLKHVSGTELLLYSRHQY